MSETKEDKLSDIIKEACITSLDEAQRAESNGANRLEVCVDIEHDGLTPPLSLVHSILDSVKIPVRVLIRPRAGNFVYPITEKEIYLSQIKTYSNLPIEGMVIGALDDQKIPDLSFLQQVREIANSKKICFHKAIDVSYDIIKATHTLVESELIDAILTSGGEPTAMEGFQTLERIKTICAGKVEVVAAGKITPLNIAHLHNQLQLSSYHGRRIVSMT